MEEYTCVPWIVSLGKVQQQLVFTGEYRVHSWLCKLWNTSQMALYLCESMDGMALLPFFLFVLI